MLDFAQIGDIICLEVIEFAYSGEVSVNLEHG